MKKLSANVCAVTHTGRVRKDNEDNYSLNGKLTTQNGLAKGKAYIQKMTEPFHLAVCDGMGGEMYGEIASAIAVESIARHAGSILESGEDFSFAISNCLDDANNRICNEITAKGMRMGTTLAAVYAVKGKLICVSLGDTRIYHFSNGILEQASFDHTHAQGLVDAGELGESEAGALPDAKRLTKHLGVFPEEATLSPNVSVIDDVDTGDVILLCSDGLTDMLSDDEISSIISGGETPQDVSAKLIRKALERGGKDNITVVSAFMTAEDTSVFAPIAEAMVGDKDPDYEEEYRNSYGSNSDAGDDDYNPYENADANADKKPVDKQKILLIVGIVLAALVVLSLAAIIIKAAVSRNAGRQNTTSSSTSDYYSSLTSADANLTTWNTTPTQPSIEDTEEDTSESESSTTQPTRRYNTTTQRRSSSTSRTTTTTTTSTTKSDSSSSNTDTTSSTEPAGTTENSTSQTESTSSTEPSQSSSESQPSSSTEREPSFLVEP